MRTLLVAAAALLLAPLASASHWTSPQDAYYVGDSTCTYSDAACVVGYACTDGAPPQAVDLAAHCALRASGEAPDIALWVLRFAWDWGVDLPTDLTEESPRLLNEATAAERGQVNAFLCASVWSFFCTNPIVLPEHVPLADPVDDFPL